MYTHPDLLLAQANDRQRELIAEADRERLLSIARLARRGRSARRSAPREGPEPRATSGLVASLLGR